MCFGGFLKILITGGTGFFGKALLRYFLENRLKFDKLNVTIISRDPDFFLRCNPEFKEQTWLKWCQGNILDKKTLPWGESYDYILHAAADSTNGDRLDEYERYEQIVAGTKNILDLSIYTSVSRFLYVSSGAVYGPQASKISSLDENNLGSPDPLQTSSTYGIAKKCAEHLSILFSQKNGVEVIIARCFAFVGKDLPRDAHFAIGNFIEDALNERDIIVNGDGKPIRSYMDQRDLAKWLVRILTHGKNRHAYNVGSDQPISILELAKLVRDVINPRLSVIVKGCNYEQSQRNFYLPSIEKAKNELGLVLEFSLKDSIQNVVDEFFKAKGD